MEARLADHLAERDSPLVRAVRRAGGSVTVERTWTGVDRHFERRLMRRHQSPRLCPRCVAAGTTAGRGLLLRDREHASRTQACNGAIALIARRSPAGGRTSMAGDRTGA